MTIEPGKTYKNHGCFADEVFVVGKDCNGTQWLVERVKDKYPTYVPCDTLVRYDLGIDLNPPKSPFLTMKPEELVGRKVRSLNTKNTYLIMGHCDKYFYIHGARWLVADLVREMELLP